MAFSDNDPLEDDMGVRDRFWSKVDRSSECWLWTAGVSGKYGQFWDGRKNVWAHRFSYSLMNGPVPEGMQVDHHHTCPKTCVNPHHLRAVTNKQNQENLPVSARSRSGVRGVHWNAENKKWRAQVTHNGKKIHVGLFPTISEAAAAATAKRRELFTHNDADREVIL